MASKPAAVPAGDPPRAPEVTESVLAASKVGTPAHDPPPFFPVLIERARGLSNAPPRPSQVPLPPTIRDIPWELYRKITYRPEAALWRGEPGNFEAQFFHMGYGYRDPVPVFVVQGQEATPVRYAADQFNFGGGIPAPTEAEAAQLTYAGMRLHANLNKPDFRDEFIVFQGASYFRAVPKGGYYGLSGRGLAVNTGLGTPEEFPRFSELYLQRPGPEDKFMWVLALLESKSVTGAYAMRVEPGVFTTIEVHAQVFVRDMPEIIGVAPLTSMYLFGEENPAAFGDFRPEVHDTDGLVMWGRDGERIFRNLHNPPRTTACMFRLDSPKGFGLVQRDRDWSHYADVVERYTERPSAWIEPLNDWGPGSVRLLEIATKLETDDNMGAMFVPDQPGKEINLQYRVHVGWDLPFKEELGRVVGTYQADWGGPDRTRFVVDFANVPHGADNAEPKPDVTVTNGRLAELRVYKNPDVDGWRVEIDALREQANDIELRATLKDGSRPLTETWSYLWQPTR